MTPRCCEVVRTIQVAVDPGVFDLNEKGTLFFSLEIPERGVPWETADLKRKIAVKHEGMPASSI